MYFVFHNLFNFDMNKDHCNDFKISVNTENELISRDRSRLFSV